MMRIVYSHQGKDESKEFEKTEVVVGRARVGTAVDLDLSADRMVSRPHARVLVDEEGRYWIEDLGSKRGTWVNGEEIKGKQRLHRGDAITIGETTLKVEIPEGSGQEAEGGEADGDEGLLLEMPEVEYDDRPVETLPPDDAGLARLLTRVEAADANTAERLALLYELPLGLAAETRLDALLQTIVERLLQVVPGAGRGALLLSDPATGKLRLKAHTPPDKPAGPSTTLARRAMDLRQPFIWPANPPSQEAEEPIPPPSIVGFPIECAIYAPLLWQDRVLGVVDVDNFATGATFSSDDLRLLAAVANYAAMAVAHHQLRLDLRQNIKLLERLLTSFSPKIREKLLVEARHGRLRPGGEKSEVTLLCSDIRGFTNLSAGMDAEDVVDLLNECFASLVEAIFKYDGTVDKYIGDAILAVFGSPEPDPQQHDKAVRAALEMQAAMTDLNETRARRGDVTCQIGIGVHCGEVLHGFIGTAERMEFTVIGDAVNRTSRYCDGAGPGEVLISPEVYELVWRQVEAERTSIPTKHEGDLPAYRVVKWK